MAVTAAKYLTRSATTGAQTLTSTVLTGGTTNDAGKIPCTNDKGKIDISLIPTESLVTNTTVAIASENLAASDYVNLYDNSGVATVRKADASKGYPAHGYVSDAVTSGSNATVYLVGMNVGTGLTVGTRYYLSATTPGGVTATPSMDSGDIVQFLGVAVPISAGAGIQFEYDDYLTVE